LSVTSTFSKPGIPSTGLNPATVFPAAVALKRYPSTQSFLANPLTSLPATTLRTSSQVFLLAVIVPPKI
jgi:hypothetical protein